MKGIQHSHTTKSTDVCSQKWYCLIKNLEKILPPLGLVGLVYTPVKVLIKQRVILLIEIKADIDVRA